MRSVFTMAIPSVSQRGADEEYAQAHRVAADAVAAAGDGTYTDAQVGNYFLFKILQELEKLNARDND